MTRFVAFLRGINVGGHIVKKETLQTAFASLGLKNVFTYKQSGNVIFEADAADMAELKPKIEERLQLTLGFSVPTVLRSMMHLRNIVERAPFKLQNIKGTSLLVTLLPDPPLPAFVSLLPLTIPKSTAKVIGASGNEIYSVTHGGGEGALPNPFLESKLKMKATTRNMNIIREIVEKFGT
jgi:uncharacterized protein (DUF1697 family)